MSLLRRRIIIIIIIIIISSSSSSSKMGKNLKAFYALSQYLILCSVSLTETKAKNRLI